MVRHLFLPASFFPSIGGAQGSMLNFISLFNEDDLVFVSLGLRGFFFSKKLKRNFYLSLPYIGALMKFNLIRKIYFYMLAFFYKPDIIWLYGGGFLASELLHSREIFGKKIKIILRSAGEDIQYLEEVNYGHPEDSEYKKKLKQNYLKADFFWSLSEEISNLYKSFLIPSEKIFQIGNLVKLPFNLRKKESKTIKIGVIGRYHAKKQFHLGLEVASLLESSNFSFIFKTPNFCFKENLLNVSRYPDSQIKDLSFWPPQDVWNFYEDCDAILITSAIESFGNITVEAGLAGCTILINENVTGYEIAKNLGFKVIGFSNFESSEIVNAINKIDPKRENEIVRKPINELMLRKFIKFVKNEQQK